MATGLFCAVFCYFTVISDHLFAVSSVYLSEGTNLPCCKEDVHRQSSLSVFVSVTLVGVLSGVAKVAECGCGLLAKEASMPASFE